MKLVLALTLLFPLSALAPEYSKSPIPEGWELHCISIPSTEANNFTACGIYQQDIAMRNN